MSTRHQKNFEDTIKRFVDGHYESLEALVKERNIAPYDQVPYTIKSLGIWDKKSDVGSVIKSNIGSDSFGKNFQNGGHAVVFDIGFNQKLRLSHGEKASDRVAFPMMNQPLVNPVVIRDTPFTSFIIEVLPKIYIQKPVEEKPNKEGFIDGCNNGNLFAQKDLAILSKLFRQEGYMIWDDIYLKSNDNNGFLFDGKPIVMDRDSVIPEEQFFTRVQGITYDEKTQMIQFLDEIEQTYCPKEKLNMDDWKKSYDGHLDHLGLTQGEVKGHITSDQLSAAFEKYSSQKHPHTNELLGAVAKHGVYGEALRELSVTKIEQIMDESKLPSDKKDELWQELIAARKKDSNKDSNIERK